MSLAATLSRVPVRWRRYVPSTAGDQGGAGPVRHVYHPGSHVPKNGRALLELPEEAVFLTRVSIPRQARRRLREAVGLRLAEASPLSVDLAEVAFGRPRSDTEGRLSVPLAITRRNLVEAAAGALPRAGGQVVASSPGRELFVFASRSPPGQARRRLALACAASFTLSLLPAGSIYLGRWEEALGEERQAHLDQMREAKATQTAAMSLLASYSVMPIESSQVTKALTALPPRTVLDEVVISGGTIFLRGHLPEEDEAVLLERFSGITLRSEGRPGWSAFEASIVDVES